MPRFVKLRRRLAALYFFTPVTSPAFIFRVSALRVFALHLQSEGACFYLSLRLTLQSELGNFARSSTLLRQSFSPRFQTMFQPCNLKGALQLVDDFHAQVQVDWSPRKAVKKSGTCARGREVGEHFQGKLFHALRPPDEIGCRRLFGFGVFLIL